MLPILKAVVCLIIIAKYASRKIQIGILNFTSSSPVRSGRFELKYPSGRSRWTVDLKAITTV